MVKDPSLEHGPMEFSPKNKVVQLCLQGMAAESAGRAGEAQGAFQEAWNAAEEDLEKFLAAYFLGRSQTEAAARLQWLQAALEHALKIGDDSVMSALPPLYAMMAQSQADLGRHEEAGRLARLGASVNAAPASRGPFYHGSKADLSPGDLLTAGKESNYQAGLSMAHVYFTALLQGAGLAAELAKGDAEPRVYVVEPTGPFEHDPNVTNSKFPGNPTRSYRSAAPLKVVAEAKDWRRMAPEEMASWRKKLAEPKGPIIN
jgi:hypothetical protein